MYKRQGITSPPEKCNIFHEDGGKITASEVSPKIGTLEDFAGGNDFFATAYLPLRTYIPGIGRDFSHGSDYSASELVITAQMLDKNVCTELNRLVNFAPPTHEPQRPQALETLYHQVAPWQGITHAVLSMDLMVLLI